jgi:cellulose biosynthesis protein BcsQ
MRKICFHIQKGGVGKTTISCTVAWGLARRGHKVVLIDCDPQGNTTSWVYSQPFQFDIADVLYRGKSLNDALLCVTDTLSLLPVFSIEGELKNWSETKLAESPRAIEFLLSDLSEMGFEYAIMDCSPSFSLLEKAIVSATDEVINPLSPEFFSVDGIEIFVSILKQIELSNRRKICNDKIVLNMLNKSYAIHKSFAEDLKKLTYQIFVIPQDRKLAECQGAQKSIWEYDSKARSIPAFEQLIDAIEVKDGK